MSSIDLLSLLATSTLTLSAAVLLVLLLRRPVRAWLGSSAAYLLWLLLPVALLVVVLPAPQKDVVQMHAVGSAVQVGQLLAAGTSTLPAWPGGILAVWLAGALLVALHLFRQQRRFQRGLGTLQQRSDGLWQAQSVSGLPAVMGVLKPRIVLPLGFEQRYSPAEQELVLLHEQVHLRRGDVVANALLASLHCLQWFNPLLLLAVKYSRQDQELSCDERVIARAAGARRSYGEAMLKTGLTSTLLPVGCHWHNHPLKERIAMLKRPVPGTKQWAAMLLMSVGLFSGFGYAAWAAQPARAVATTPGATSGGMYATAVRATLEGQEHRFELREAAGKPFSFSTNSDKGVQWTGEFVLQPAQGGLLNLQGSLKANGALVSSPTLLIKPGVPAGIEVSTADGSSVWKLEITSTAVASATPDTAAAATQPAAVVISSKNQAPPSYPKNAFDQNISGKVVLQIEVGADGQTKDVSVVESQPQGVFDAVSIAAARQWRFTPAQQDGKPMAGKVRVPIWFDMDEDVVHTDDAAGS